jgi:putative membrane protein
MIIFYLLIVLIGVSFAALNATSVKVNFYFAYLTIPISVLIILSMGIGILLGILFFLTRQWRLKAENRRIRSQLRLTEKEIKNLRSIPLKD